MYNFISLYLYFSFIKYIFNMLHCIWAYATNLARTVLTQCAYTLYYVYY